MVTMIYSSWHIIAPISVEVHPAHLQQYIAVCRDGLHLLLRAVGKLADGVGVDVTCFLVT